ncbi:MAG: Na+/H+ antiporter NhaC [Clostridiales Family XIII bacterium]|jgi:NhaC family Na+:H+ antiporter|nr:Na+/H+ antiporter NhaC [Clostridiales Family XIII bacterium]
MGRKIPMWQVAIVMIVTIGLLCYALNIFHMLFYNGQDTSPLYCGYGELHVPLIFAATLAAIIAIINGYKWKFLENGIIASISRSMQACLILLVVGMLIGSWIASGVVPAMIYYGLMILSPGVFLVASCLICCIVSLASGSSWTTAGTIGIALVGVGFGLGINPAMTAGAIVSGAYFGDKMSPLSDTTNMAPAVAGSTLFEHIRHMIWTVTPSLIIALVIYAILGLGNASRDVDMSAVKELQDALIGSFNINPALLIPPLLVIVMVALKTPALPGLIGGTVLGVIMGMIFQGIAVGDIFGLLHYGYESVTGNADIDNLLTRGGMDSMLWTVNLIICAMTIGGVMDSSGMLAQLAEAMLKLARNVGSLVTVTIVSCLFMNVIASDQYLAIILPGRMYREAFEDMRLKNKNLSRCLEDSGTMTSPLVPWNTCGATMSTFLGVPTVQYIPYAFLNLLNPIVSIFYGFTGISMEKMTEAEYKVVLANRKADKAAALKALEA